MAGVKVQQVKGLTFIAKGSSNHWIPIDTKTEVGGTGAASGPMELVLFGLGGCTAIDCEMILKKMQVPVESMEIEIDAERSEEHPKVFTKINMVYHFWGKDLPLKKLEKAVKLSKDTYCSVSAMLAKTAEISAIVNNHDTT